LAEEATVKLWGMKHLLPMAAAMLESGEGTVLVKQLLTRLYANQRSLILRCDMRAPHTTPVSKIPLYVRTVSVVDLPAIVKERPRRLPVLLEAIPTCYLVVTDEEEPAYMQWVVLRAEWPRFKPYFAGDLHKELEEDECVFEFAYTFQKFRGLGVMGAGLSMIAKQALSEHPQLKWGYTYVLDTNVPSLKGCHNAGFFPYMQREERWRAMSMKQEFSLVKNQNPSSAA
jgi:hypothetical protein